MKVLVWFVLSLVVVYCSAWRKKWRPYRFCGRGDGYCIDWRQETCPAGYYFTSHRNCGMWGICCMKPQEVTAAPPSTITPSSGQNPKDVKCGVSVVDSNIASMIVGGRPADKGEYPWQVSLKYFGDHWCGGTLLNDRWVMTAAHCFIGKSASDFTVSLGEHDHTVHEGTEQQFDIDKIIDHQEYHFHDTEHDLSLVKLSHVARLNDYVTPACMPGRNESFEGMYCTVTGWGHTEYNGLRSDILREVTVPVLTRQLCAQRMAANGEVYKTNICAGHDTGGMDACQGDSGGPLNCRKTGEAWKVVGVVSWGDGCGREEKPGVYTSVGAYSEWIQKTMEEN